MVTETAMKMMEANGRAFILAASIEQEVINEGLPLRAWYDDGCIRVSPRNRV